MRLEQTIIALLLQNPERYFQVARVFNSLLDEDRTLQHHGLSDLSVNDFSDSACRHFMQIIEDGWEQEDMLTSDYITAKMEHELPTATEYAALTDAEQLHALIQLALRLRTQNVEARLQAHAYEDALVGAEVRTRLLMSLQGDQHAVI